MPNFRTLTSPANSWTVPIQPWKLRLFKVNIQKIPVLPSGGFLHGVNVIRLRCLKPKVHANFTAGIEQSSVLWNCFKKSIISTKMVSASSGRRRLSGTFSTRLVLKDWVLKLGTCRKCLQVFSLVLNLSCTVLMSSDSANWNWRFTQPLLLYLTNLQLSKIVLKIQLFLHRFYHCFGGF